MRTLVGLVVAACWLAGSAAGQEAAPAGKGPLKLHMICGAREYKARESMTALKAYLEKHYPVRCTTSLGKDGILEMPNLDALDAADVMVVYCRRTKISGEQLKKVQAWCKAGRPIVGLRTASHAFQNWLAFDKEVLGGDYKGHGGSEPTVTVKIPAKSAGHPVLAGVREWTRPGRLYRNPKLAKDVTVLCRGTGKKDTQPVAWVRTQNKGRVFYSSLGIPRDFPNENFRRLLINALFWTAGRKAPTGKLPPWTAGVPGAKPAKRQ